MKKIAVVAIVTASIACAQGGFQGSGFYEISSVKSGKVLDLDRNDQTTVIQSAPGGADNQRWYFEPAEAGFFFISNAMNWKALQAVRHGNSAELICARFDRSRDQQWRLQLGKDGDALIVSRNGRTIDIPDGSSRDGLRVQMYDLNGDSNQRFLLRRVPDRRDDRKHGPLPSSVLSAETDGFVEDGVCFYRDRNFRGEALCTRIGADVDDVPRGPFGSIKLFGRAQGVEVFERPGFRGERFRINRDARDLERNGGRIGSFRVF